MPRWVTVWVSDALIIKACNTDSGSGGVARDLNKTAKKIKLRAIQLSPRNNPMNATKRGHLPPGTYQRSFKTKRTGNQHILTRVIQNTAEHAGVVEDGRRSTQWGGAFWNPGPNERFPGWQHSMQRAGKGERYFDQNKRYTFTKQVPGGKWETFGWTRKGGAVMHYAGTSGRQGRSVLQRSLRWGTRKYTTSGTSPFVPGRKIQVAGKRIWR